MKKRTWIPLLLIGVGIGVAFLGFAQGGLRGAWADGSGWHLAGAELGELVTVEESYDDDEVKSIDVNVGYIGNITLKEGNEFSVRGENYERYGGLEVRMGKDGTLSVYTKDQERGKWFNLSFGFFEFGALGDGEDTFVEITWPKGAKLNTVNADISASDIRITGLDCDELTAANNFGRVDAEDVNCTALDIKADAGDVRLADADVEGAALIDNNFGDVSLSAVRADNISATLDAGDMEVDDVVSRTMEVKNHFGKINLDGTETDTLVLNLDSGDLTGLDVKTGSMDAGNNFGQILFERFAFTGLCEIENDAGNVGLSLSMKEDSFSYELDTDSGFVRIGNRSSGSANSGGAESLRAQGSSARLKVDANFGNIEVSFGK
jgi:DUF4097 and DUF4098 domain-containing protein YvlB